LYELTRFGESMDQALSASVSLYSAKLNDARNLLLGVLGHDLRNPLSVVHMASDSLLQAKTLTGEQTEVVARIHRSAERMRVMVRDILDFTETALGVPLPISPEPCDLAKLAANIVGEVRTVHRRCTVKLSCVGDLTGTWDPERVGQLLSNLVSNAVQHGTRGKPVSVHVSAGQETAVVRIHNEGVPISLATQKSMFSPLRQTGTVRADRDTGSSGLGLGLYITREIAQAHGGSIEVTSSDEGTTFTVSLPRVPPLRASGI
jgi:signal transduction histidine kinase